MLELQAVKAPAAVLCSTKTVWNTVLLWNVVCNNYSLLQERAVHDSSDFDLGTLGFIKDSKSSLLSLLEEVELSDDE